MFSELDAKFMKIALEEAEAAYQEDEVPVGAVLVIDNKIIARSHNKNSQSHTITRHAEINVIEEANKIMQSNYLMNATIYITLEPCYMCLGAIYLAKIKRIVYATKYKKAEIYGDLDNFLFNPNLAYYPIYEGGLFEIEAKNLLQKYFLNKR